MSDPESNNVTPGQEDDNNFDPELREHLLEDLAQDEVRFRLERKIQYALIAFGVALLTIICLAIWASTIRARVAITVFGDGVGGDGQPTAVRVVVRDPKTNEALRPRDAELTLQITGQDPRPVQNVVLGPETVDAALFADAEALAKNARLSIRVTADGMEDRIQIALTPARKTGPGVKITDAVGALQIPDKATGAIDEPPRFPRFALDEGSVQVRLYPESGSLVPVLGNNVWLLGLHRGRVYPGLKLKVDPPGWELLTDAQGLAELRLTTGRELGALKIKRVITAPASQPASQPADEPRVESAFARATLDTPPSQILTHAREVLVIPGKEARVDVSSVRMNAWLSFEVWYGERLVALSYSQIQEGQALLDLPAPEHARTIMAVRLARSPVREDVVSDTAFFYVDDAPIQEAWRHLLADLGAEVNNDPGLAALAAVKVSSDEVAERLMRVALSRARLKLDAPPELADSSMRNHAMADSRRRAWQGWLFGAYWLLGLGALALAVIAVLVHNRNTYRRLDVFSAEASGEDDETARTMRRRGTFELIGVVIGMTFGLFIVYYLLANLWWG